MNHFERLIYNLRWRRVVWRYKGFEWKLSFRARRSPFSYIRYSSPNKGFVWWKLSMWGAPICEVCNTSDGGTNASCPACCEHEYDWSEGYTCLNCGHEGDVGGYIDSIEHLFVDR